MTRPKQLYVVILCLLVAAIPFSVRSQQPNVAVRESSSLAEKVAVIEERLRSKDLADVIQITEIHRRLDELNNHRAMADKAQAENKSNFVSIDSFGGFQKDIQGWRDSVNQRLTSIEQGRIGASSLGDALRQNGLALVSIAGFIYLIVTRRRGRNGPGSK